MFEVILEIIFWFFVDIVCYGLGYGALKVLGKDPASNRNATLLVGVGILILLICFVGYKIFKIYPWLL